MKLLIVGGSGFIGHALVAHLQRQGHTTIATGFTRRADIQLDARSITKLSEYFKSTDFDLVINLAGAFRDNLDVNTCSSMNIVEAMYLAGKTSRFIHVASATENLTSRSETHESDYSFTKEIGTSNYTSALTRTGFSGMTIVLHNTYGTNQPNDRFIAASRRTLASGQKLKLNYPRRIRDFVYQPDVNLAFDEAINELASTPTYLHQFKEIGTGTGVTLYDAALIIAKTLGLGPEMIEVNSQIGNDQHSIRTAIPDPQHTYICKTSFVDGINKLMGI
ncbi:WcaG Nucleoside-diphosphate-sugar epimerases [Candidatus Nanopelagicaceae bacterium]